MTWKRTGAGSFRSALGSTARGERGAPDHVGQPSGQRPAASGALPAMAKSVVPLYPFLREGSPSRIDYRKEVTPILTSLLEDLVGKNGQRPWENVF